MANPNWKKGMPRVPGAGLKRGTCLKHLKTLEEVVCRIALEHKLVVDPAEILLLIGAGIDPLNPNGERITDINIRMDAAKAVINYIRPKLSQVEVQGSEEKPLVLDTRVSEELSTDPRFRELAEALVIKQAELLGPKLVEGVVENIIDVQAEDDDAEDEESLLPLR